MGFNSGFKGLISYISGNFIAEVFPDGHHILPRTTNSSPLWCVKMTHCLLKDSHIYIHVINLNLLYIILVLKGRSRDSSVGTAVRYGLDSSGIESRWGRDFPHPSRPSLWPTQPLTQWVPCLYWGKAAGVWR